MEENYILTEDMTVGYGGIPLIRQIGIHVRPGEIVTLIGLNGAGRSTTLRSVIRQLGLLEGAVYLDGTPMQQIKEREIAKWTSILMTKRIHPELMTYEDVVNTGHYPYTGRTGILTAEDRKRVREAMEPVHTWDLARRDFSEISDGQKQRVLLARAVCQEPRAIALDEPTSFLDIRHKLELLTILKGPAHEKMMTVLISLHELDLTQELPDYVIYVNGEYIERHGTPEEILTSSYITSLYGITKGSYHAELGCLEVEPVRGTPQVFVIGRSESGISVYEKLQRMGVPSATGILHENNMDYPIVVALAVKMILKASFELIREETYERTAAVIESCDQVICCLKDFGTVNEKNRKLAGLGRGELEPRRFS